MSGNVTINAGVTLYIMTNATLDLNSGGFALLNSGTIHNNGTIDGQIVNVDFPINSSGNSVIINYSQGYISLVNNGNASSPNTVTSSDRIINYGFIGIINNGGEVTNMGTVDTLSNYGVVSNYNKINLVTENGRIGVSRSGLINNYGTIDAVTINRSNGRIECWHVLSNVLTDDGVIIRHSEHESDNVIPGSPDTIITKLGNGIILQIGANGSADQRVKVFIENMGSNYIGLQTDSGFQSVRGASISTRGEANDTIAILDGAINMISTQRASLGAMQNRLEHTVNNLGVTRENLQSAESAIRDVDMAREMMSFTKNNILIQTSQSMLTQANQLPQGVLQLLR